jgi:hypothetical protein
VWLVSTGPFFVAPFPGSMPAAYVSPVSGPVNDVRLHPQLTTASDGVQYLEVTPDSQYAYYLATLNGVAGVYASDLQSPGTAVRMDTNPNNDTADNPSVSADSSTLFYALRTNLEMRWFYSTFAQPSVSTPFAPLGPSQTVLSQVVPAPVGSSVVFMTGDQMYITTPPFTSAAPLLPGLAPVAGPEVSFLPGSSIYTARRTTETRRFILNLKAPGFYDQMTIQSPSCAVFAGQVCP